MRGSVTREENEIFLHVLLISVYSCNKLQKKKRFFQVTLNFHFIYSPLSGKMEVMVSTERTWSLIARNLRNYILLPARDCNFYWILMHECCRSPVRYQRIQTLLAVLAELWITGNHLWDSTEETSWSRRDISCSPTSWHASSAAGLTTFWSHSAISSFYINRPCL